MDVGGRNDGKKTSKTNKAMDETTVNILLDKVMDNWDWLVNNKNPLAFNEIELDKNEFAEIIKNTYELIYTMAEEFAAAKLDYLGEYIEVISMMSEYSAEWASEDESEDAFFTVSRLIAKDLVIFGSYPYIDRLGEKKGIIHSEVAPMCCYEKECSYNVNENDFSEYIELAMSGMCP